MAQPWGKKSVRIAIAIGEDADQHILQKFIGHTEIRPLKANNSEALKNRIKWTSTVILQAASSPATQTGNFHVHSGNVAIPMVDDDEIVSAQDIW